MLYYQTIINFGPELCALVAGIFKFYKVGVIWPKTKEVRHWTCPVCGCTHDRDINAANNILKKGVGLLAMPAAS